MVGQCRWRPGGGSGPAACGLTAVAVAGLGTALGHHRSPCLPLVGGPVGRLGGADQPPLAPGPSPPRLDRGALAAQPAPVWLVAWHLCGGGGPLGGPLGAGSPPLGCPPIEQCTAAVRWLGAGGGAVGQGTLVLAWLGCVCVARGSGLGGPGRRWGGRRGGGGSAGHRLVPVALVLGPVPPALGAGFCAAGGGCPWRRRWGLGADSGGGPTQRAGAGAPAGNPYPAEVSVGRAGVVAAAPGGDPQRSQGPRWGGGAVA